MTSVRRQQGAANSAPIYIVEMSYNELLFFELFQKTPRTFTILQFLFYSLRPYLELASVVLICGALSALLQCNESETPEISRAGCQEDHCKAGKECGCHRNTSTKVVNK